MKTTKTMMMALAALSVLASGITGCAVSPQQQQAAAVSLAHPPDGTTAERCVREYIGATFKDPYSVADLQIGVPQWNGSWLIAPGGAWVIMFSCNAKNSFGGYTGTQPHAVVVRNGVVDLSASESAEIFLCGKTD